MAYELDNEGKVKVFTFTVRFFDGYGTDEIIEWDDSDYSRAWERAREAGEHWCELDETNRYEVSWEYTWRSPGWENIEV